MPWLPRSLARTAVTLAVVCGALVARARGDTFNMQLEPSYTRTWSESTDALGRSRSSTQDSLSQNYRLSFDKTLFPSLDLTGLGTFERNTNWPDPGAFSDDYVTSFDGRLRYTLPTVTAGAGYDWRLAWNRASPTRLVNESISANASWRPPDLPALDASYVRTHLFDRLRAEVDRTSDAASFNARYTGRTVDTRYSFLYSTVDDQLEETMSTSLANTLQASYADSYFDHRTSVFVTGSGSYRTQTTTVHGTAGTVTTQRAPIAGLSLIETFQTPEIATLDPNPALVDGNTAVSANINVGFSQSLPVRNRVDLGAQFADVVTKVNRVWVWVDRRLPDAIASQFVWAAYASDDNQFWTPVAVTGLVVFDPFENRFEIPIAETQARYLKVVTQPLPATATTDAQFRDIFVTELQFYLVVPATSVPHSLTDLSTSATATARTLILNIPAVSWDVSGTFARTSKGGTTAYTVVNGLTLTHKPVPQVLLNARVARLDQDLGRGHEAFYQYGASATARPVPTFMTSLVYSGQAKPTAGHTELSNSLTSVNRADLYQGVSATATGSGSIGVAPNGDRTKSALANASLGLTPNRYVSFTAGWNYNVTVLTSNGRDRTSRSENATAATTITPFPAAVVSGSVTRIILGARPTTIFGVLASYSPLQADITASVTYSTSIDVAQDSKTEILTPSLRWTVRTGWFVDVSYTKLDSTAPVGSTHEQVVHAGLLILL